MEGSVSRTSQNMEGSESRIPKIKQNLQVGDEFLAVFGSLGFGKEGHLSIHNSDVNTADCGISMNIVNPSLTKTQRTSDQTQSFLNDSGAPKTRELLEFTSANSVGYENMGGSYDSVSKGKEIVLENSSRARKNNCQVSSSNASSGNQFSYCVPVFASMAQTSGIKFNELSHGKDDISKNLGDGSSTRLGDIDYFFQSQSDHVDSEISNTDVGKSLSYNDPILRTPMNPFRGIKIDELRSSREYHTMNNSWNQNATHLNAPQSSSSLQIGIQGGVREFMSFQETLGNYNQRAWRPQTLFSQFQGSFLELMTDERRNFLFEKLLHECDDEKLDYLVQEVFWMDTEVFLNAAFCKVGSASINKLIKRIKKTIHAYTLTRLLSTRLYYLMTDNTAMTVIKQCLNQFGSRPNEVLYENVILYHTNLATHEVGCISLNKCLSTISGMQKVILLNEIAENAVFLSNDPYGNYVLQQAMFIGHDHLTPKILHNLRGHFTQLSQERGGSHVVEKCVNSSRSGTTLVVEEILQTPSAPFRLARHQYGNYVIQAALRNLKRQGNETLYLFLVKALEPHFPELQRSAGGKQIVNLIIGELEIHINTCRVSLRSIPTLAGIHVDSN